MPYKKNIYKYTRYVGSHNKLHESKLVVKDKHNMYKFT